MFDKVQNIPLNLFLPEFVKGCIYMRKIVIQDVLITIIQVLLSVKKWSRNSTLRLIIPSSEP